MVGLIVVEPDDTDSMLTYGLDDPFKARSPSVGAMPMFNKLSYLKPHEISFKRQRSKSPTVWVEPLLNQKTVIR